MSDAPVVRSLDKFEPYVRPARRPTPYDDLMVGSVVAAAAADGAPPVFLVTTDLTVKGAKQRLVNELRSALRAADVQRVWRLSTRRVPEGLVFTLVPAHKQGVE